MNKSLKSRIPVREKSSKLCNAEKKLLVNKSGSSLQNANKFAKTCQSMKDQSLKKTQSSLNNNKAYDDDKNIKKILKNNIKCIDDKFTVGSNMKHNADKKTLTKTFSGKPNVTNKKYIPFSKNKMKSTVIVNSDDNRKENLMTLKNKIADADEVEMCTPKGNKLSSKQEIFSAQKDIKFEANEFYRNMILSNRELSPSMCKLLPNLRVSSLQAKRPSAYQKVEASNDPLKEALKALENTCLSARSIKRENKIPLSPYRDRSSIYTPCAGLNQGLLKRLEDFKFKQLQKSVSKSAKKVTFNLNVEDCTPKYVQDIEPNSFKNSECRLMKINEKSEENTPNSPQSEKTDLIKVVDVTSNHEQNDISAYKVDKKDSVSIECKETETEGDTGQIVNQISAGDTFGKSSILCGETFVQNSKKTQYFNSPRNFICDSKQVVCDISASCQETNNVQSSEQKVVNITKSSKVYTPQPISFSSLSKRNQSYTPEFLTSRNLMIITELAPICTPLVLKSKAKNMIFSPEVDICPVRLKLDFTEVAKDTPKKEISKSHAVFLDNIDTIQKKLDDLADQECCFFLSNESFPVICGRYLTNPVAQTLSEGDDMHFIPIQP